MFQKYLYLSEARNAQVPFAENPQMKTNSLKKPKHVNLIHTWSDKAFSMEGPRNYAYNSI